MNALVMYSGGLVSWAAGKRTVERYGREQTRLLFADTLIEDEDLYRFVIEGAANIFGIDLPDDFRDLASSVPAIEDDPDLIRRRPILAELMRLASRHIPGLHWIADGRTPFEVFADEKFIGNTRVDPCSRILKRELMNRWRDEHCENWRTVVVFGLDWSERGRIEGRKGKPGHRVRLAEQGWLASYPMDETPYLIKDDIEAILEIEEIRPPNLYALGFPHNNCGGYCCKMGLAQANHLLRTIPARYAWNESQEERAMAKIGPTAKPSLRYRSNGSTRGVTLREFRRIQEQQSMLFDEHGWGCGGSCAIDDVEAEE